MDDRVEGHIADVRRLGEAVDRYERDLAEAVARFERALAASTWHDPAKQRFQSRFRDLALAADRFVHSDLAAFRRRLVQLEEQLEQLRQMRR